MGKRIQALSLPLGIAAFGSYALVMAVLLAFVAGFFNAATGLFFAGLTFALGCWICLGLIFGTASERSSAIVIIPAVIIMAHGLGALGLFAGRLIDRIAKAVKTRRPAG